MIDYHKELVAELNKILPTYYVMVLHSGLNTPCISYFELNNSMITNSNSEQVNIGYSKVSYQISVWGNDIGELNTYAAAIDNAIRPIGWKRISSGELYDNNSTMIQKVLTYEALFIEDFTVDKNN